MVWDSNIIIYSAQKDYPFLRSWAENDTVHVSAISYIEVLGYYRLKSADRLYFDRFFRAATLLDVNFSVVRLATQLRQQKKMSLGDALIAATAITQNLTLISRNKADFLHIQNLTVIDPFEQQNS